MNRNPFESSTSLFSALPFALLLLLGIIAAFGPRKIKALQLAARDHSREWARTHYPVVKRAAARIPAQARQWTREYAPVVKRAAEKLPARAQQWTREHAPVVKRAAARLPAQAQTWTREHLPLVKRAAAELPTQTRQWARATYPVLKRRAADDFATLRHHIQRVAAKARQGLPKE
jgi:hypothetical protein